MNANEEARREARSRTADEILDLISRGQLGNDRSVLEIYLETLETAEQKRIDALSDTVDAGFTRGYRRGITAIRDTILEL